MKVWIDQDDCTGAGLCVDHCPELFIVLEDGIGYVHQGRHVITDAEHVRVPRRYEQAAIDAVERASASTSNPTRRRVRRPHVPTTTATSSTPRSSRAERMRAWRSVPRRRR
jgi:ferredoxin